MPIIDYLYELIMANYVFNNTKNGMFNKWKFIRSKPILPLDKAKK